MMTTAIKEDGRAYAFYDMGPSEAEAFGSDLPAIRRLTLVPATVEINRCSMQDAASYLTELAKEAGQTGRTHAMEVAYPAGTNRGAAHEAAAILNQAKVLYRGEKGVPFEANIVFRGADRRLEYR